MSAPPASNKPSAAVGVVCLRGDDVLLIRRAKAPLKGHWSLPGGRIEWGERVRDAALRELKEETGCEAEIAGLIDVVDGLIPDSGGALSTHYVLIDYAARWVSGEPIAGDDAADARFVSPGELAHFGLWAETIRVIDAARALLAAP